MRLGSVERGPVTLEAIDWSASQTEETFAFRARLTFRPEGADPVSCDVRNDGRGGANLFSCRSVERMVEAHAATLPPVDSGYPELGALEVSADFLVSMMVEEAILRQRSRKGRTS